MARRIRELKSQRIKTKTADLEDFRFRLGKARREHDLTCQLERLEGKLDWVIDTLKRNETRGKKMNKDMQEMAEEITAIKTTHGSAIALINGLSDKLDQVNDLSQLKTFKEELKASRIELANAVTANTPAADEPSSEENPNPEA